MHQQQDTRQCCGILAQAFKPDLGPDQGLDAALARLLVELDGTKQVAQIGDGERRLVVTASGLDDVVNAAGAVNYGKFGVQTQMDKHGSYCARPIPLEVNLSSHEICRQLPKMTKTKKGGSHENFSGG